MPDRRVANSEAMEAVGAALARAVTPPAVITLTGPLGVGKTTLVRGFLRALGHDGPIRSPTYTLIESYPVDGWWVHHLDLYRIADPDELELIGIRDLATPDAVWLVEWPERGGDRLPAAALQLHLEYDGAERLVRGLPAAIGVLGCGGDHETDV